MTRLFRSNTLSDDVGGSLLWCSICFCFQENQWFSRIMHCCECIKTLALNIFYCTPIIKKRKMFKSVCKDLCITFIYFRCVFYSILFKNDWQNNANISKNIECLVKYWSECIFKNNKKKSYHFFFFLVLIQFMHVSMDY